MNRKTTDSTQARGAATLAALFAVTVGGVVSLVALPAPPVGAEPQGEKTDARALLRRMMKAEMTTAYIAREATFRADGPGTEQWVRRDPKRGLRRESIRPPGEILVDNLKRSWLISPSGGGKFIERPSFLKRMQGRSRDLMKHKGHGRFRAEWIGKDVVAGRDADIVSVRPPEDVPAPSHRFWIDRETGLRLKTEEREPGGRVISGSYYLSLNLSPKFRDEDFARPEPPPGVRLQKEERKVFRSVEEAARAGITPRVPGFVPPGFALRAIEVSGGDERIALRYGNGMNVISLVQLRVPLHKMLPPEKRHLLGPNERGFLPSQRPGGPRAYAWRDRDRSFLLFGNLPEDQLKRIADSVR